MAESILYSLAQEVLKNLGSTALTEFASAWGFKNQLNRLKNTTNTLKDVLLDAEERQADSHAANSHAVRGWLERLSTVVYAADDLFDEFNAVAAQKQLNGGHKLTKKVCTFFSHSNQVVFACKISCNIKKIREELDDIERDGKKFEFVTRSPARGSAISRMRDQTISYVDEHKVVGRDDDKKIILDMLLTSSATEHELGHEELRVIPIVGMGGMGKTTLAQLLYNDPQVKEYFDLRLWVCVSDVFDLKVIIDKLLKSATNKETPNLEMDQLQGLWQKEVANKKYLLVLDDVWNETREEWLKMSELLKIGKRGSKIIVTTRSKKVAEIMGISRPYELQGLTKEMSWILFQKLAFKPGEAEQKPHLVKIGKEVVQKCGFVPLAIRTLGSLLYGEEEKKWLLVRDTSLAKILDSQNGIMNILRLSYHHLWSPLKNCFAYCALFPKDYEFKKEMLIDLWIAEGFIVPPSNDGQSVDEAAEDYFHTLLQRGFFQDIEKNSLEVIQSCKMHDLMHDLAEEVAGVKCKVAKSDERTFDEKSIHLSLAYQLTPSWEIPNSMLNMKLLRTFFPLKQARSDGSPQSKSISQAIVTGFRCLRVLDLHMLGLQSLPSSISKLIHLRYLNLSYTPIEKLPDSITHLWNLQTLKLFCCTKLRSLPANMRNLINLRSLDVAECYNLSHMPSGLGELTSLTSLPRFIVKGKHDAANSRYKPTAKLSDLKDLNNLRGELKIDIKNNLENTIMVEAGQAELRNKHELTELEIFFPLGDGVSDGEAADCKHDEAGLQGLEPPSNIKSLKIGNYRGENLLSWARMDNFCTTLPNLVQISLWFWKRCQQLPAFSQLPLLKSLELVDMGSVEYIESDDECGVYSSKIFFPSLEQLDLSLMGNLKGWWKEDDAIVNENDSSESTSNELAAQRIPTRLQFSKLSKLSISSCPNLRLLPVCPNVEDLSLLSTNKTLSVLKMATTSTCSSSSSSSVPSSTSTGSGLKLKKLEIDNAEDLMSLPNHCLLHLSYLLVCDDNKLESTERLGDVFANLSSSLRSLSFWRCYELRSIAKGLKHLTKLEDLEFYECTKVDAWGDEEGMPWKALNSSLRSLTLFGFPKLVGLPRGLQHLSNLRSLSLQSNEELEELPEWMSCFSSLQYLELYNSTKLRCLPEAFRQLTTLNHLEIINCPELKARCQEGPNGREWPKIQHISLLSVRDDDF